jgi:hypothetical protein
MPSCPQIDSDIGRLGLIATGGRDGEAVNAPLTLTSCTTIEKAAPLSIRGRLY